MSATHLLVCLNVAVFLLAGCERAAPPVPSTRSVRPPDTSANLNAVTIATIDPHPTSQLRVGDNVKIRAEIAYNLNVETGTVSLVVQGADNSSIAQKVQAIAFGSGKTLLETEFTVPNTGTVQVFVPLHIPGGGSSVVVDYRAYRVAPK